MGLVWKGTHRGQRSETGRMKGQRSAAGTTQNNKLEMKAWSESSKWTKILKMVPEFGQTASGQEREVPGDTKPKPSDVPPVNNRLWRTDSSNHRRVSGRKQTRVTFRWTPPTGVLTAPPTTGHLELKTQMRRLLQTFFKSSRFSFSSTKTRFILERTRNV